MIRKKLISIIPILLLGIFISTSCSDNPSSVSDDPPPLPDVNSMEMDFTEFESQSPKSANTRSADNFSR